MERPFYREGGAEEQRKKQREAAREKREEKGFLVWVKTEKNQGKAGRKQEENRWAAAGFNILFASENGEERIGEENRWEDSFEEANLGGKKRKKEKKKKESKVKWGYYPLDKTECSYEVF